DHPRFTFWATNLEAKLVRQSAPPLDSRPPDPASESVRAAGRERRSGRGSWWSTRRGSGPYSDPGGVFRVGGMLMHAHRGAVDHLHIAVKGLADRSHDAVPNPGFAPPHKAVVAGRGRAELLRQSAPRRARPQHPENSVEHPPIIHPRHS